MSKTTYPCSRCDGRGRINGFSHVIGGVCFKCGGSGTQEGKPAKKGIKYAVFLIERSTGKPVHIYNEIATSAEQAIKKASVTAQRASESFKAEYTFDGAFAILADEVKE